MNSEKQTTPIVEAWLKGTSDTPYGTEMGVGRVKSRVRQTRQRSRWWPLPSFQRGTTPAPSMSDTEFQPTSIPSANGQTPTVIRRTQSMFSPVKAVAAGALVFAIGGVLLIAQPFDQQADVVPGAEAEFAPPEHVTGRLAPARGQTLLEQEGPAGHLETWGYVGTATSSDPRLEGVLTFRNENLVFDVEGSEVLTAARAVDCDADPGCEEDERGDVEGVIFFLASSIENDGGVWRQRPWVEVGFPGADFVGDYLEHRVEVYDGEEGYEGLVAVLMFDTRLGLSRHEFSGFIVDARVLPPLPETASAE